MNTYNIEIESIIRSERKSISLAVTDEARLVIRAPLHVSDRYIKDVVRKKTGWIRKKIEEVKNRKPVPVKKFIQGEAFLYLGRSYPLLFGDKMGIDVQITDNLVVCCGKTLARDVLIHWYRERAMEKISERCHHYSSMTALKPLSVKISNASKRWGSCSSRGSINFAWRLVMAPLEVIDYVVVHELTHLKELNHSKKFWNRVESVIPDYRIRQKWLRDNGRSLVV